MHGGECVSLKMVPEGINSDSLDYLRSILVKSLSSENVSKSDVMKVKQYKNNKKVQFNASNIGKIKLKILEYKLYKPTQVS